MKNKKLIIASFSLAIVLIIFLTNPNSSLAQNDLSINPIHILPTDNPLDKEKKREISIIYPSKNPAYLSCIFADQDLTIIDNLMDQLDAQENATTTINKIRTKIQAREKECFKNQKEDLTNLSEIQKILFSYKTEVYKALLGEENEIISNLAKAKEKLKKQIANFIDQNKYINIEDLKDLNNITINPNSVAIEETKVSLKEEKHFYFDKQIALIIKNNTITIEENDISLTTKLPIKIENNTMSIKGHKLAIMPSSILKKLNITTQHLVNFTIEEKNGQPVYKIVETINYGLLSILPLKIEKETLMDITTGAVEKSRIKIRFKF